MSDLGVILMRVHPSRTALIPADTTQAAALQEMRLRGIVAVQVKQERVLAAHRKLFALFGYLYDLWEPGADQTDDGVPIKRSRTAFRQHLTVLAGHYRQVFRPDGSFTLEPGSLSYECMDQAEFEQLYGRVIDIALTRVAALRGMTVDDVDEQVLRIVNFIS